MRKNKIKSNGLTDLRRRAEEALQGQNEDIKQISVEDIQHLVSELRVHQIELEMQNEELLGIQKELEKSGNRYADLYDFAPIGYFTFDKNGQIIDVNLTGANKLGIERSSLIRKSFYDYTPEDSKDKFYLHLRQVFKTRTRQICELKLVDNNGTRFDARLESLLVQHREDNFDKCRTAISDITAHKHAEEQIREQAALLDKAHDAIIVQDLDNRITYWNTGAQGLYGWTKEEIIGKKSVNEILFKDNEESTLINAKKSIIDRGEWCGELRQRTKDGKELTVENRWTLVHDSENKPKSILIINTDITEKKRLELQLLRAQRMESIGTLAGGIAHNLNNMLTPTMLSLRILRERCKDELNQRLLNTLEHDMQRGAALVDQILSFARGIEGEYIPLQVAHIISEIENIIKETFPRNIEIRTEIQKDISTISGDAIQLHQVIMNLCMNAHDAMPNGGILSITASNVIIDENYTCMNLDAKVGSYIVISVSDTGTGIPPEIIDRIFEPFFTTKEFGQGTGLGLSTALGIVKSHGGFIDVKSETGAGTTFKVYLPAIKTEMQNIEEHQPELVTGNGELILVAEDEDSVREITCSALEAHGYRVLAANDGAEAIAQYAQNMEETKVILMDLMMPVMDGEASIRAIRRINPQVKIIAVSGLAEKDRLKNVADTTNAFLPKPYTSEKLLKTIHEVLISTICI